jgi:hypothetical protein
MRDAKDAAADTVHTMNGMNEGFVFFFLVIF